MALVERNIIEVFCTICGWNKRFTPDWRIDIPFKCPACGDGESKKWSMKEKKNV